MRDEAIELMARLEGSHWWYRSLRRSAAREVRDASSVLDVGCGTGGMFDHLEGGGRLVGVDLSSRALNHGRGRRGVGLVRGDAANLPFPGASFDAVLCLDVLYHAWVEDEPRVLGECARVLAPGGKLVVQVPAFDRYFGGHDESVMGVRRYRAPALSRLVRGAGLAVEKAGYRNLLALLMAEVVRKRRPSRGSDLTPLPAAVNRALDLISRGEEAITRTFLLPLGLSVWCVARKKG